MNTITQTAIIKDSFGRTDIYNIVDEFPQGYIVWPIGRRNFPFPGYIPLARPDKRRPCHILRDDLKTIKIQDALADFIMEVATRGTFGTIDKDTFEKLIKSHSI